MILADSGFWVALLSARDKHHAAAVHAMEEHQAEAFVTTWPVLTEACYLLSAQATVEQQQRFLKQVCNGGCQLHDFPVKALDRMAALMHKYRDLPMDLADASLVLLAEEFDEGRILSTDERDFNTYRWKNSKPFQNLLLAS